MDRGAGSTPAELRSAGAQGAADGARTVPGSGRPPLHPFLFAAYPVLSLYGQNVDELRLGDILVPLLALELVTAAAIGVVSLLMRNSRRAALVVSASLLGVLLFALAERILGRIGLRRLVVAWDERPVIALAALLVLVVSSVVIAWRLRARLASVTGALDVIAAILVVIALVRVVPDVVAQGRSPDEVPAMPPVVAHGPGTDRDIYYIVLDRYGSERAIASLYGITDNDLDAWLTERGFQVLPDAHANYVSTTLSLSSVLNLEYLQSLIPEGRRRSSDRETVFELLDDHRVGRFLQAQGYEYVHVGGWWTPTRSARIADVSLASPMLSEFESLLLDRSILPHAVRALGIPVARPSDRHAEAARFQFDTLERVRERPGPTFVFAHILLPHPPYVFLADGTIVDRDSRNASYATQLAYTNLRVRQVVEPLLSLPEAERPIIIIQAEEGPYPRREAELRAAGWANATGEELEQKYGILSAFHLPGSTGAPLPPTLSSVNTFRLLLERYFGAELPPLEDRSWVSPKHLPYDFTEITHRLPSLAR